LKPFIEFMQKNDSEEVARLFSLKKLPSLFGPDSFITEIKEKYYFNTDFRVALNRHRNIRFVTSNYHKFRYR